MKDLSSPDVLEVEIHLAVIHVATAVGNTLQLRSLGCQAAFTAKELREVLKMEGIQVKIPPDTVHLTEADKAGMKASRARKRIVELLQSAATASHES